MALYLHKDTLSALAEEEKQILLEAKQEMRSVA
jgi:hypothetical protein